MDFLPGALDLDPGVFPVEPGFAGRVLWLDALVGNVDRSWRNVNMLRWHGEPYLIDHGATLTFHHGWSGPEPPEVVAAGAARPYDASAHVLLGASPDLDGADAALAEAVSDDYGLAATVLTPSMANAQTAWRTLPVGTVKVNDVFGGAPGGAAQPRRGSGSGFGYGPELLDEMTTVKVVHLAPPPA
jgi:hypothetical protein